jgi:hypothetical protein
MSWFIVNLVIGFANGEGQLLVFPKAGNTATNVKYVLSLKTQAEVQYWTNRFAQAKANGASGLMVKANFTISERGYVNNKSFTKNGKVVGVGEETTYYIRLSEGIKSSNVTDFVKGQGRISALPEDDAISSIPS